MNGHISFRPAGVGGLIGLLSLAVVATMSGSSTASATVAFARDTGRRCGVCHATPGSDMVPLTRTGQCFSNNDYRIEACEHRHGRRHRDY